MQTSIESVSDITKKIHRGQHRESLGPITSLTLVLALRRSLQLKPLILLLCDTNFTFKMARRCFQFSAVFFRCMECRLIFCRGCFIFYGKLESIPSIKSEVALECFVLNDFFLKHSVLLKLIVLELKTIMCKYALHTTFATVCVPLAYPQRR